MPCHTRSLIRRDFCVQVSATDINMLFCIHTLHACAHRDAVFVGTTHSTIIFSFTKQTLAFTSWNFASLGASWFRNDSSAASTDWQVRLLLRKLLRRRQRAAFEKAGTPQKNELVATAQLQHILLTAHPATARAVVQAEAFLLPTRPQAFPSKEQV